MIAKRSQLSSECRRFFRGGPEPREAAAVGAGKPMSIQSVTTQKTKPKAKPKKMPTKPAAT
jgi:hypothetical protein